MKIHELYSRKKVQSKFQSNENCTFIAINEKSQRNKNHQKFIDNFLSYKEELQCNERIILNNDRSFLLMSCVSFIEKYVSNNDLVIISDEHEIYLEVLNIEDFLINYFKERDTFDFIMFNETKNISLSISEEEYELKFYLSKW